MPIVTLYAGILGLWLLTLSVRVIGKRRGGGPSLGDGGDTAMQRRIRAQANLAEYAPLGLILLWVLETAGQPAVIVHGLGIMLVTGRLLHGWALSFTDSSSFGRFWGTLLTLSMLALASLLSLISFALA